MNSSIHPASDHRRRIPKREQILNGAREVFFALGFEGASMNEIAKAAGVSKGTLYSYFVDKVALFEAVIAAECEAISSRNFMLDLQAPLEPTLSALGAGFLRDVFSPTAMGVYRTLVGEAHRNPALGEAFMRSGPRPGSKALAAVLESATARGLLNVPDPELAAFQFIHLCDAGLGQRVHMGEGRPTDEDIQRHVSSAVGVFLRGYAR